MSNSKEGKTKSGLNQIFSDVKLQNLLAMLTVILVACLIAGILQIVYLGWPFNQYISAIANDIPLVRPGAIKIQMNFGVHYFGDFLQPLDWARQANPWTSDPKFLAQYPPLAVYLLKPLTFLPYRAAVLIYLFLMILSSVVGIWIITKKLIWSNRVFLWLIFGVASVPFLMAFDRGNLVGFFTLLFSLFVFGVSNNKRLITWISLGLMISIKIYPVFLLIVLFRQKRYKESIYSLLFALISGIVLFAITPGSLTHTISQFIAANTGGFDLQSERQIRAFAGFMHIFINAPNAILQSWEYARLLHSITNFFRIGLLVISVLTLILKPKIKLSELLFLSCIAMTTLNSSQIGYNWFWAPVFVVWLISEKSIKVGENDIFPTSEVWKTERFAVIGAIGFCLLSLPIGLHVPGSSTPLTPYIGLITCFIAMISLLFGITRVNLNRKKHLSGR